MMNSQPKIYFAGSIRGGRDDAEIYLQIIAHLQTKGTVLTEHVGSAALTQMGEYETKEEFIHDRDMEWLLSADVVVAEVTQPSLGVGYELGRAIEHGIKILALYRPQEGRSLSAMIRGSKAIEAHDYQTIEEAKTIIDSYLGTLSLKL